MKSQIKIVLLGIGIVYCLYYFANAGTGDWHFIDNVDLIIHEAGHFLFMPFGRFIMMAGGSLLQVIVPLLFFGYFWRSGQKFSAATMLLWLSLNFFYIAVYASDAIKMQLPLLGGEGAAHDWNYLLMETGLIAQTSIVANIIYFLGLVSIALAGYVGWLGLFNTQEEK